MDETAWIWTRRWPGRRRGNAGRWLTVCSRSPKHRSLSRRCAIGPSLENWWFALSCPSSPFKNARSGDRADSTSDFPDKFVGRVFSRGESPRFLNGLLAFADIFLARIVTFVLAKSGYVFPAR